MASTTERGIRQWSELPIELLQTISQKFTLISDYLQFRAVCTSWRSAAAEQFWLLLPYSISSTIRPFYSVTTNKIYSLNLPQARRKAVCASSHGWLFLLDKNHILSLLNPITKVELQLPPTDEFPCFPYHSNEVSLCTARRWDAALSSHPMKSIADCVVIFADRHSTELALCKIGDAAWTMLDTNLPNPISTFLYHKGRIYAMDLQGNGVVVHAGDFSKTRLIPSPVESLLTRSPHSLLDFYILAKSPNELLLVVNYWKRCEWRTNEECIEVFKLNKLVGEMQWSKVESTDGLVLFLSKNKSSVVSACAQDVPGVEEDCIYFDSAHLPHLDYRHSKGNIHYLDMFNVRLNTFELVSCHDWKRPSAACPGFATWLTPSLF